jgi:drug/metabolite transporter (DMT)-like permease
MFSALVAALFGPLEVIGTKKALGALKINYKSFLVLNNFFIFTFTVLVFALVEKASLPSLAPIFILAMLADIILAVFYNFFFYYSISGDNVSAVYPVAMLAPIVSVVLATAVYPSERNWPIFMVAIIGSLALALSRIEKHHLKWNKYLGAMLGFVFLSAIGSLLAKYLMEVLSPISYYAIRVGMLTFLASIILRPNLKVFGDKRLSTTLVLAFLITVEMLAYYTAIHQIGIVKTSLIFLLSPVLILLGSRFYLKEKISRKAAIADIIIVGCILASIFIG